MDSYEINFLKKLMEKTIQAKIDQAYPTFSASREVIDRISARFLKSSNELSAARRMDAYIDQQTREDYLAKKIQETKDAEAREFEHFFKSISTASDKADLNYFIDEYSDIIAALRLRRISYEKNGLNVFSLLPQATMQLRKNGQKTFSEMKQSATDKVKEANDAIIAKKESIINNRERKEEEANNKKDKRDMLEILNRIIKDSEALEKLKRKNPNVFNEIIGQNKTEDDDFISEVGITHSSR